MARWGESVLNQPTGIFWDAQMLLVADSGNRRIVIFDASGIPLEVSGIDENRLIFPVDVAMFQSQIYILDAEQACVHVFEWTKKFD